MREKGTHWAIGATLLVLGLATSSCSNAPTATDPAGSGRTAPSPARDGKKTPQAKTADDSGLDFTVETFEGEVFSLAEQRGTPVVLNFWESW